MYVRRIFIRLLPLLMLATAPGGYAADKYEPVDAKELASSPQRYWAAPIVFTDTLLAHPGKDYTRVSDVEYFKFKTANVGDCYAPKRLLATLKELKLKKEYSFVGTVLQKGGKYMVIAQTLNITVSDVSELPKSLADVVKAGSNAVYDATFKRMEVLMRGVQNELVAHAKDKDVDVRSFYDPLSKDRGIPAQVMRAGVMSMADQLKTSPTDILVDFLVAILARESGATGTVANAAAPATPAPADTEAPAATAPVATVETIPTPAPVPEPVVEAAPEPAPEPLPEAEPAVEQVPAPEPEPVVEPAPEVSPAPEEVPATEPAAIVEPAPEPIVAQDVTDPVPEPEPAPIVEEQIQEQEQEEVMVDEALPYPDDAHGQTLPLDQVETFTPDGVVMPVIHEEEEASPSNDEIVIDPFPALIPEPAAAPPAEPAKPAPVPVSDADAPVPMR